MRGSFIAIVVLFLLTASEISSAVLAFSEPERISGKVVSYKVTRLDLQEKTVRKYTLYILTITDIDKRPVFMKKGEKFLKVISSKPVPSWVFLKRVKMVIKYSGDERGGNYWLLRIEEVE